VIRVAQVVMKPQGQSNHPWAFRDDFGAATEAGEIVMDVAIILPDREGQVFSDKELIFGNEAIKALPTVG
jgi:hypothetical protein